ncbi:CorA metal ion transporter [Steccherinum ochraceum]|uniref:CorA metal ion transporter n=1 Tax=Steccherinum ochraceum TaxID=92696 RepID=A0A4R0RQH6_9APHY|nr:CorA metal ion transporter [Steccherinum ochraceum]
MSSPSESPPILVTSPKPIRGTSEHSHSPVRRRNSIVSDEEEPPTRPRLSPTLIRSFNPLDPEHRERQRTMDADMAMQLSRARSNTVVVSSPAVTPSPRRLSADEEPFPRLSLQEEHDLDVAKQGGQVHGEVENHADYHPGPSPDVHLNHLSMGHDPSLLVAMDPNGADDGVMGGLPMYQATDDRPLFDFGRMEEYAREEKGRLGVHVASPIEGIFDINKSIPRPSTSVSTNYDDAGPSQTGSGPVSGSDFAIPFPLPRSRQRKLSQSHPGPRRGKMALFEQTSAPPPTLPYRAPHLATGTTLSAVPSYDNLPTVSNGAASPDGLPHVPGVSTASGHDRPYRFSFYSNHLSATIHAKSLSELPADGQTFEELFTGGVKGHNSADGSRPSTRLGGATAKSSGTASPVPGGGADRAGGISKLSGAARNGGGPNGPPSGKMDRDILNTWWLDIQSPTEDEMKLLTKVFSIHPLTTEDILMEETREKIELFRTYYFVCFRSFEQDPYSPTYLEPLNMYIIVFREGILSFHFRPTPHPQNVRRRIKQLKDYINVTSDWISYALIDDITDAFGPLIQSIEYEVDSIDELVLILKDAEQSDMLRRIGTCRKKVMGLLRLMGNKADVVKGLAKRCNENWRVAPTSDIGLYLSDIQDHLITMTQNLNHYEKILSRSHSNYLAQISIEMTDANNQINDVLSKLTALGTVLIPMNLVTGLWGMNVHVPGQDLDHGYAWFLSIIAVLAAFAVIAGWSTYKLMIGR